jgi:hypothetical protein
MEGVMGVPPVCTIRQEIFSEKFLRCKIHMTTNPVYQKKTLPVQPERGESVREGTVLEVRYFK